MRPAVAEGVGMDELQKLHDDLLALEKSYCPTSEKRKVPEWWTVAGYRMVIEEALKRISDHEARAIRAYGERAPRFEMLAGLAKVIRALAASQPGVPKYGPGTQDEISHLSAQIDTLLKERPTREVIEATAHRAARTISHCCDEENRLTRDEMQQVISAAYCKLWGIA